MEQLPSPYFYYHWILMDLFEIIIWIGLLVVHYAYFGGKINYPRFIHYIHYELHDSEYICSWEVIFRELSGGCYICRLLKHYFFSLPVNTP